MRKIFLNALLLSSILVVKGQQNTFAKTSLGSQSGLNSTSIVETSDNGFIIAGNNSYFSSFNTANCYLTKVNSMGNFVWNKGFTLGSTTFLNTEFRNIISTKDSNYLIVGKLDTSALCIKINSLGDTIWSKSISATNANLAGNYVQQTNDSGYIIVGAFTGINVGGNSGVFLAKLGTMGNLLWSKVFSDTNDLEGYSVKQIPDSGFIIVGTVRQNNSNSGNAILLKTDKNGMLLWSKNILNTYYSPNDLEISDNSILCLSSGLQQNPILTKFDFAGNVIWSKSYNVTPGLFAGASKLRRHKSDGNGYLIMSNVGYDVHLIKTDTLGGTLWRKIADKPAFGIIEAKDKGIVIVTNGIIAVEPNQKSATNYSFGNHFGIVKMDSSGNAPQCIFSSPFSNANITTSTNNYILTSSLLGSIKNVHPMLDSSTFTLNDGCVIIAGSVSKNTLNGNANIIPNPSKGRFTFKLDQYQKGELFIYNTLGQMVLEKIITDSDTPINLEKQAKGIYHYILKLNDHSVYRGKIAIE